MVVGKAAVYFFHMPSDNTEDRVRHRQRILDAAQRCFVRNGLHGTSMGDVARESGLSEDAVSGHFTSRDDLVQGIADNIAASVSGFFAKILDEEPVPPLGEIVERFAETIIEFSGPDGPGHLTPIFWASALYNATMAERARTPLGLSRSGWIEIAERELAAGNLAVGADPRAVATVLVCLLPGLLLQRLLLERVDAATVRRGLRDLGGPDTAQPR